MNLFKFCVLFGIVAMLHAAYSAAQHRTYIRLTEQEFTTLPLDIIIQCLIGLLITCYGVVQVAGTYKEIKVSAESESKTWDMLSNRQAFFTFNHRGKSIYSFNRSEQFG